VFDPAATKAGVGGLAPHELRHMCASLAIRSRASIKTVQRLVGHATAIMTLDNYGHLYPDELGQLAQQMGGECVYRGVAKGKLTSGFMGGFESFDSRLNLHQCAISSAGERFPDTEEVTGSIPVSRTSSDAAQR
jgi:integrase-like protein